MLRIDKYVTPSPEQWDIIIEGMRNPMDSWDKSDSGQYWENGDVHYTIGRDDLALMKKLSKAGSDHRKFMRMTPVWVTINAPLYWWKEFDQYKVGTTSNSRSTMHKIDAKEFSFDDFSCDRLSIPARNLMRAIVEFLEHRRVEYVRTKDKRSWHDLIQLLPSSYNQKRLIFLNYEVLHNIYHARRNHKLDEWRTFCEWIRSLPYSEIITGGDNPCTT